MTNLLKDLGKDVRGIIFCGIIVFITILNTGAVYAGTPTDINKSSAYAKESIMILYSQNIISGDARGNYNPKEAVTRGQAITLLVKILDLDTSNLPEKATFRDVPKGHWAFKFVETAYREGIVSGISPHEFGINNLCTREQIAVMLTRALGLQEDNIRGSQSLDYIRAFSDYSSISNWAKDYVEFTVFTRLIQGISKTQYHPRRYATKEQLAVILDRFMKDFKDLKETAYYYEVGTTPNISYSSSSGNFYISFSADFMGADVDAMYNSQGARIDSSRVLRRQFYRHMPEDKKSFYIKYRDVQDGETYNIQTSYGFKNKYGQKIILATKKVALPKEKEETILAMIPRNATQIVIFYPEFGGTIDETTAKNMNNYVIRDRSGNKVDIAKVEYQDTYKHGIITLQKPIVDKTVLGITVSGIKILNWEKELKEIKPFSAKVIMGEKNQFLKSLSFKNYNNDILKEPHTLEKLKNKTISIMMNGDEIPLSESPIVDGKEILVPLQLLTEMKAETYYNPKTGVINVGRAASPPDNSYKNILYKVNESFAFVNHNGHKNPFDQVEADKDKLVVLEARPRKIGETIYLPLGYTSKVIGSPVYIDDKSGVIYLRERQQNYPMLYKALRQDYYTRRKGSFSLNAQFNEWTSKEKLSHESIGMKGVINNLDFQLHTRYLKSSKSQSFDISREIKSIKNNVYEKDLKTEEYKELRGEGRKELELLYNSEVVHVNLEKGILGTQISRLLYQNYDRLPIRKAENVVVNGMDAVRYTLAVNQLSSRNINEVFGIFLRNYRFSDDTFNLLNFYSVDEYDIEVYVNKKQQIVKEVIKAKYYDPSQALHKDFKFEVNFWNIDQPPEVGAPIGSGVFE